MNDPVDVLVIGAGPVGLLLATELQRAGVGVRLIERSAKRSYFCKALGVSARTLEIFEDLGMAEAAVDAGVWIEGITVFQDGVQTGGMDVPAQGLPYGALSLAQFETERLLEACLRRHGGRVEYGRTLTGFSQDAEGVRATIEGSDGEQQEIPCHWLVGCEGAHSVVRHGLGIDFEGDRYPQTFLLADIEADWSLPRGRIYRFNRSVGAVTSLVAVPIAGSVARYRLSMIVPDDAALSGETPAIDEISALMGALLPAGTRLSSMRWSSTYRVSHRLASAYGKGRVFLAGDAAHIHPPVGGQGMNTGLQDAHNLAWKLMMASRGTAGDALMASYSAERRPVGEDVVRNTSQALNAVIAQQANLPALRETQLFIGYRDSAIVRDDRPQAAAAALAAGDRAPDAGPLTRPFVAHAERLHQRLGGGRHVLVGQVGDRAELDKLADLLDILREMCGDAAAGLALATPDHLPKANERIPLLIDSVGAFRSTYGDAPGTVWLIRPDGHVGWCSTAPSAAALRRYLAFSP